MKGFYMLNSFFYHRCH